MSALDNRRKAKDEKKKVAALILKRKERSNGFLKPLSFEKDRRSKQGNLTTGRLDMLYSCSYCPTLEEGRTR